MKDKGAILNESRKHQTKAWMGCEQDYLDVLSSTDDFTETQRENSGSTAIASSLNSQWPNIISRGALKRIMENPFLSNTDAEAIKLAIDGAKGIIETEKVVLPPIKAAKDPKRHKETKRSATKNSKTIKRTKTKKLGSDKQEKYIKVAETSERCSNSTKDLEIFASLDRSTSAQGVENCLNYSSIIEEELPQTAFKEALGKGLLSRKVMKKDRPKGKEEAVPVRISVNAAIEELLLEGQNEEESTSTTSSDLIQEIGYPDNNIAAKKLKDRPCHHRGWEGTTADVLKWMNLREQYLNHIIGFFGTPDNSKNDDYTEKCRIMFVNLLPALRKVTTKIVRHYVQSGDEHMKGYISKMASDMNFMNRTTLAPWINVNVANNTFVIPYSIDGVYLCQYGNEMPAELMVDEDEMEVMKDLGFVIWKTFNEYIDKSKESSNDAVRRVKFVTSDGQYIVSKQFSMIGEEYGMIDKRFHEAATIGTRHYFQLWKQIIGYEKKIECFQQMIARRVLREIIKALQMLTWQSANFRRLQQSRIKRHLLEIIEAWKDYSLWCRRFNRLRMNSDLRVMRYCMEKLKVYGRQFASNRRRKYSRRLYLKREAFRAIVYNLVLSQFQLKNRLQLGSEKTFFERSILKMSFQTWRRYPLYLYKIKSLNNIATVGYKKIGFRALFKNTWKRWPENDVMRMDTGEKVTAAAVKIASFMKTILLKGNVMWQKSCEVGRKVGSVATNKSMIILTKIPGIRGIMSSNKDAEKVKKAKDESLYYQRMKVIRAIKRRSGVD